MDNEANAAQEGRFGSASLFALSDALNAVAKGRSYDAANFALARSQVYATLAVAAELRGGREFR